MSKKRIKIGSIIIIFVLLIGILLKNGPVNNYKNPTKKKLVAKRNIMLTENALKQIQGGVSGQFETIYFGSNGEFSWKILNPNEDSFFDENNVPVKSILIMASSLSQNTFFSTAGNDYENSTLRNEEIKLANEILSPKEAGAILNTTKPGGEVIKVTSYSYVESQLYGDKFFAPTAAMMNDKKYGLDDRHYRQDGNYFWLSAASADNQNKAGYISKCGVFSQMGTEVTYLSARATANLKPEEIVFISAAKGDKSNGPIGSKALLPVKNEKYYDYRLTLKDLSQTIAINNLTKNHNQWSFDYSSTGAGNRLSAIVVYKKENEILYYGHLADLSIQKNGQAVIELPKDFDSTSQTIKIFSEQYNGDYKTDYASELIELL